MHRLGARDRSRKRSGRVVVAGKAGESNLERNQLPTLERSFPKEEFGCQKVVNSQSRKLYD